MDPHSLSWLVRLVPVAAMAVLLGGAVIVWAVVLQVKAPVLPDQVRLLRAAATPYEWAFWGATGLLVSSGVGNLGAFGAGLPAVSTAWGQKLTIKLALVLLLLLWSLVRTLWVVRLEVADVLIAAYRNERRDGATAAG